jgi:hypothetical protein
MGFQQQQNFLDICTGRWVVSFTPPPLYPREKIPGTHWIGLGGPQSRFGLQILVCIRVPWRGLAWHCYAYVPIANATHHSAKLAIALVKRVALWLRSIFSIHLVCRHYLLLMDILTTESMVPTLHVTIRLLSVELYQVKTRNMESCSRSHRWGLRSRKPTLRA